MPHAFKTKKGGEAIGISGVGGLAADGGSVLSIEQAALTMPELQEQKNKKLVLDKDGKTKPLTGAALVKAAKEWAEARDLEVVSVKEDEITPTSSEVLRAYSIRRFEEVYGDLTPVNDDPDQLATAGADESAILAAPVNPDESVKED